MTTWQHWPAIGRHLVLCLLLGAWLLAGVGQNREAWGQQPSDAASLEAIKTTLDEIETALGGENVTAESLAGLAAVPQRCYGCRTSEDRRPRAAGARAAGTAQTARSRARRGCAARKRGNHQRARRACGEFRRARRRVEAGSAALDQNRAAERTVGAETTCIVRGRAVRAQPEHPGSLLLARRVPSPADRAAQRNCIV